DQPQALREVGPVDPLKLWSLHSATGSAWTPEVEEHHLSAERREREGRPVEPPQGKRRRGLAARELGAGRRQESTRRDSGKNPCVLHRLNSRRRPAPKSGTPGPAGYPT